VVTYRWEGHSSSFDHPASYRDPETPTVSVELTRVVASAEKGATGDSLEVVLTNTGKEEIAIPVGDDPVPILAPYAADRRELSFWVLAAGGARDLVGSGTAVSSAAYPDSQAHLAPGDSVAYKLPINRRLASNLLASRHGTVLQLTVRVQIGRVVTQVDGVDLHQQLGDEIRSENSLPWPPE
jgi:hypothetical protein